MARAPRAKPPTLEPNGDDDQVDKSLPVVETDEGGGEDDVVSLSANDLQAQLDEANRRADAAEAAARAASAAAERAQGDLQISSQQVIENAIAKAEADKRELKAKLREAKETGDYDAETDALDELQKLNITIARMGEGKAELDRRVEDEKNLPADPVERYLTGIKDPKSQAWIRRHPEVVTDPAKTSDLEAAHFRALGSKLRAGSAEYFAFMDEEMGYADKPPAREQQRQQQDDPPARRENMPSPAPVRGSGSGTGSPLPAGVELLSNGNYRLSDDRREAARIAGVSDAVYLKSLLELAKEGRATLN